LQAQLILEGRIDEAALTMPVFYLWCATELTGTPRGVLVVRFNIYPTGLKVGQIVIGGGRGIGRREQTDFIDAVRAWAVSEGCQRLEYSGREGFLRACKGADGRAWKKVAVCAVMDLA
jgi:hypothetical protein